MGFFSDFFGGKKIKQQDLRTPEQLRAQKILLQMASSGNPFTGSLGDFSLTGIEQTAGDQIRRNLGTVNPAISQAQGFLTNLAGQGFNPEDPSFQAFERRLARSTRDQADVLNREAAITGNRFGTAIAGEKADLAERQSDILAQTLGNLFNQAQGRSLGASQALGSLGLQSEDLEQSQLNQALNFGALERGLRDAEAKSRYNEFLRQQQTKFSSAGAVLGASPQLGVREIETQSPFSQLLNTISFGVGQKLGASLF